MAKDTYFDAGKGRLFYQRGGPGPANPVLFLGCGKLGGITQAEGDITPVYCPDPATANKFVRVAETKGAQGLPTSSIAERFRANTVLLGLKCPFNVYAYFGDACSDLTDRKRGWKTIVSLQRAAITNRTTDDLTALDPEGDKAIMINADITAEQYDTVTSIAFSERASSAVSNEVIDVTYCDSDACNPCGAVSEGCEKIYAVATKRAGSPGLPAEVLYSADGGATWSENDVTSLLGTEGANAIACVSSYVVVASNDSASIHYADKSDLTDWDEVGTGFVPGKGPLAMMAVDAGHIWLVGTGGYVYFSDGITNGVEVQDAGVATSQNLNAVHMINTDFGVAVGANNAVVMTDNGGATWAAITGPAPAVALNTVWCIDEDVWFIGTAGGKLYYTVDGGTTWTEKTFSGSGTGTVSKIVFVNDTYGFMSHATTAPLGRIFRTTDGGYSWYLLPEGTVGTIPANDKINSIAACKPNTVIGVGLADNAVDGIIVVGS